LKRNIYIIIAIDSTKRGIKVTNNGPQWLKAKWNVKNKEYLKIHIYVCSRRCEVQEDYFDDEGY
jgi:hypothetical protein